MVSETEPWHGTLTGYQYHRCRCSECRAAAAAYRRKTVAVMKTRPLALDDPRHGTVNGYGNLQCRCAACRAAWAEDVDRRKHERGTKEIPEHVHGTENGYGNYRCRCDACTAAWSAVCLDRLHRRLARRRSTGA